MNALYIQDHASDAVKGVFFQKVQCVFQISKKNIPKNYPELEIQISRQ